MQIKAFVQDMFRLIDMLAKEQNNEDKNVLVKLELMETLECLKECFKQILLACEAIEAEQVTQKDRAAINDAEITHKAFELFKDFLAERWSRIKNTDSVYFLK